MLRFAVLFLQVAPLAQAGHCSVGTTSVDLVAEKGYNLTGQTHVLTGGDSGLGLGISTALMQAGARVIFLAHDVNKTQALVREMQHETGNGNYRVIPCNLLSLDNTKKAAEAVLEEERIDVFIGDAGATGLPSFVTKDGFEAVFQMEYLSHFYLAEKLLPQLRKSHGRIVFTGSSAISPSDSVGGLCNELDEPQGCEALDRMDARSQRVVPPKAIMGNNGNVFLGLYLRVMLARYLAMSEPDVMAFSFHPGWAETPATESGFDQRAYEFFGSFMGVEWGLGIGAVAGCIFCYKSWRKRGRCTLCGLCLLATVLVTLVGGFVGYLTSGPWVAPVFCRWMPYYQCVCNNADGTEQTETCPISASQGALPGMYLASASRFELKAINGAMTVVCGEHPDDSQFDPYTGLVSMIGKEATATYLEDLYKQSQTWIETAEKSDTGGSLAGVILSDYNDYLDGSFGIQAFLAAGLVASSFTMVIYASLHLRASHAQEAAGQPLLEGLQA